MNFLKAGNDNKHYIQVSSPISALDNSDEVTVYCDGEIYGGEIQNIHENSDTFVALECRNDVVYIEYDEVIYVAVTNKEDELLYKFIADKIYVNSNGHMGFVRSTIKDLF